MNHHKRIVVDFDDTIALPVNRDWGNALPNLPLIEKLNKLSEDGWIIDIFTARGSISCATRDDARDKYLGGMIEYLERHNVRYNSISFDKPLASYYIDDKAITPETFIEMDIRDLQGGLSGSTLYTDGRFVHKKDPRAHEVRAWYEHASNAVLTPRVERIVGDVITMEYIEHLQDAFALDHALSMGLVQDSLERLRQLPILERHEFAQYVDRIRSHVELASIDSFNMVLEKLKTYGLKQTFAHGDFGVKNLLIGSGLYLIDPIPGGFGCTEIDAAKLYASLFINEYPRDIIDRTRRVLIGFNDIDEEMFRTLAAAEAIRVYKYHPDKEFIEKVVTDVFQS